MRRPLAKSTNLILNFTGPSIIGTYKEQADEFVPAAARHGLAVIVLFVRDGYCTTQTNIQSCQQMVVTLEHVAHDMRQAPPNSTSDAKRAYDDELIGSYRQQADEFVATASQHGLSVIVVFARAYRDMGCTLCTTLTNVRSSHQIRSTIEQAARRIRGDIESGTCGVCERCSRGGSLAQTA